MSASQQRLPPAPSLRRTGRAQIDTSPKSRYSNHFWSSIRPYTVRGPDIAFIRRERVPHPSPAGFAAFPPDLVVEIRSPSDRPGDMLGKVGDWLAAGTRLVWVIDPERRLAHVYRQDGTQSTVDATEPLTGEDVLPGFSCELAAIL